MRRERAQARLWAHDGLQPPINARADLESQPFKPTQQQCTANFQTLCVAGAVICMSSRAKRACHTPTNPVRLFRTSPRHAAMIAIATAAIPSEDLPADIVALFCMIPVHHRRQSRDVKVKLVLLRYRTVLYSTKYLPHAKSRARGLLTVTVMPEAGTRTKKVSNLHFCLYMLRVKKACVCATRSCEHFAIVPLVCTTGGRWQST